MENSREKNDTFFCENFSWTVYFAASIFKAEKYCQMNLKKVMLLNKNDHYNN